MSARARDAVDTARAPKDDRRDVLLCNVWLPSAARRDYKLQASSLSSFRPPHFRPSSAQLCRGPTPTQYFKFSTAALCESKRPRYSKREQVSTMFDTDTMMAFKALPLS